VISTESAIAFEATLAEAISDVDSVATCTITEHVATALQAVTSTVFPFWALEMQQQWMQRRMHKPADLSTRQMAAAINKLNNALPLFPLGSTESKFSEKEIVGLLEWLLPQAWRSKFDLDGYIPTLHSKTHLTEACEAIERNTLVPEKTKPQQDNNNDHSNKNSHAGNKKVENNKNECKRLNSKLWKHCTVHGHNALHDSSECYTLKNQTKPGGQIVGAKANSSQTFTAKRFRKKVNMLAQKLSKKKVLELYANAVKQEQKNLKPKDVVNPLSARLRMHLVIMIVTAMSQFTWSHSPLRWGMCFLNHIPKRKILKPLMRNQNTRKYSRPNGFRIMVKWIQMLLIALIRMTLLKKIDGHLWVHTIVIHVNKITNLLLNMNALEPQLNYLDP
jgi:hypothetical protein